MIVVIILFSIHKGNEMPKMTKAQIDKSLEALKADIAVAVESASTMRGKVQHALVGCVSHWKMTGSKLGKTKGSIAATGRDR